MDRTEARERVLHLALQKVLEDHPIHLPGAYDAAQSEYTDEQLALACRDYARAVDALEPDERPIGWEDNK